MAPSQMEQEFGSPEYTHKKFNCGYSHKKLGLRFVRRPSQEEEEVQQEHDSSNCSTDIEISRLTSSPSTLFRPYALEEENTKTKSYQSLVANPQHHMEIDSESPMSPIALDFAATYQYYVQYFSQQQSPDAYALKLQRQRADLYMKYIMQYYDNGNGWPTIHPNAFNNSH